MRPAAVSSPVAAGFITSIDTKEAESLKGVVRIFSAKDVPGKIDIGPVFPGDILLTDHEIEYFHQPVLFVVADSYDTARKAARLVKINCEETEAVLTFMKPLKSKTGFVHHIHYNVVMLTVLLKVLNTKSAVNYW